MKFTTNTSLSVIQLLYIYNLIENNLFSMFICVYCSETTDFIMMGQSKAQKKRRLYYSATIIKEKRLKNVKYNNKKDNMVLEEQTSANKIDFPHFCEESTCPCEEKTSGLKTSSVYQRENTVISQNLEESEDVICHHDEDLLIVEQSIVNKGDWQSRKNHLTEAPETVIISYNDIFKHQLASNTIISSECKNSNEMENSSIVSKDENLVAVSRNADNFQVYQIMNNDILVTADKDINKSSDTCVKVVNQPIIDINPPPEDFVIVIDIDASNDNAINELLIKLPATVYIPIFNINCEIPIGKPNQDIRELLEYDYNMETFRKNLQIENFLSKKELFDFFDKYFKESGSMGLFIIIYEKLKINIITKHKIQLDLDDEGILSIRKKRINIEISLLYKHININMPILNDEIDSYYNFLCLYFYLVKSTRNLQMFIMGNSTEKVFMNKFDLINDIARIFNSFKDMGGKSKTLKSLHLQLFIDRLGFKQCHYNIMPLNHLEVVENLKNIQNRICEDFAGCKRLYLLIIEMKYSQWVQNHRKVEFIFKKYANYYLILLAEIIFINSEDSCLNETIKQEIVRLESVYGSYSILREVFKMLSRDFRAFVQGRIIQYLYYRVETFEDIEKTIFLFKNKRETFLASNNFENEAQKREHYYHLMKEGSLILKHIFFYRYVLTILQEYINDNALFLKNSYPQFSTK